MPSIRQLCLAWVVEDLDGKYLPAICLHQSCRRPQSRHQTIRSDGTEKESVDRLLQDTCVLLVAMLLYYQSENSLDTLPKWEVGRTFVMAIARACCIDQTENRPDSDQVARRHQPRTFHAELKASPQSEELDELLQETLELT